MAEDDLRMRVSIACLLLLPLTLTAAQAGQVLKNIQILSPLRVELQFDEPVKESQLNTEYVRDIIQVNLNNVVVYPAKILTQSKAELSKVFAYQYTPKQVRCRLSMRGNAENYKGKFKTKVSGKSVILTFTGSTAAQEDTITVTKSAPAPAQSAEISAEGQSMLGKIFKSETAAAATTQAATPSERQVVKQPVQSGNSETVSREAPAPIKFAKPLPSPLKSFAWLGVIIVVLLGTLAGVKKMRSKGMSSSLLKFTRAKFGGKEPLIEMVANQYLGPKKSISVVRVKGRLLVLGVSDESIQLITELGSEDEIDSMLEGVDLAPTPKAAPMRMTQTGPEVKAPSQPVSNFRDEIRKRMEGMKTLS